MADTKTVTKLTEADGLKAGAAMRKHALSIAAKTGTEINLVAVRNADIAAEKKMTAIALRAAILSSLSEDDVADLPLPGSKWNDNGVLNNNPDIGLWVDPAKPDGKPKEISFYVEWSDNTDEGRECIREIDWCKRIFKENMKVDDIPSEWQEKYGNPEKVKDRLDYLEGRRGTIRTNYKDAVRLIWQMDMVNELIRYELGADGQPDKSKVIGGCTAALSSMGNQIRVGNRANVEQYRFYSVGAFLKLNPAKAQEQDGSYAALNLTATRPAKTPETPKGGIPALNSVQTPDTADKVAAIWLSYIDKCMNDKNGTDYAALLKHMTGAGGQTSVHTMATMHKHLGALLKIDTIAVIAQRAEDDAKAAA